MTTAAVLLQEIGNDCYVSQDTVPNIVYLTTMIVAIAFGSIKNIFNALYIRFSKYIHAYVHAL